MGIIRDNSDAIDWENIHPDNLSNIQEAAQTMWQGWQTAWFIFAGFALVVAIAFWIFFPKTPVKKEA